MTNRPTDDRDLDVEVAYMLGWRMCLGTGEDGASWMTMESPTGETMEERKGSHWNYRDFDVLPHYSTDHNLAFQVVEAMKQHGAYVSGLCQITANSWVCTFLRNGETWHRGAGGTAAKAICKAALACVQERGEREP